uniref:Putative secreted protein n=1 Tax=Anopheles darlingi TaxID=43151 RepID=A0A2M4DQ40_ANODA
MSNTFSGVLFSLELCATSCWSAGGLTGVRALEKLCSGCSMTVVTAGAGADAGGCCCCCCFGITSSSIRSTLSFLK